MRLVFAGTPEVAVPVADRLALDHEIVAVLTRPPAAQGRSARLVASPVEAWARSRGVEVLAPDSLREEAFVARLTALAPQCCPVVAYGGLITRALLALPDHGWINLHFSLLPAYRGAAPVQRALLDGRHQTGLTTFQIVPALDAGPVYLRRSVEVAPTETAGELLERLSHLGAEAMAETLRLAEAGVVPAPQAATGVSLAPKISTDEARLDFSQPVRALVDRVRAMSPDPGAWALLAGQRFKVLRAVPAGPAPWPGDRGEPRPGDLWATKRQLFCRAGDGWAGLGQVQVTGKKPMAGADWARGAWQAGSRLD